MFSDLRGEVQFASLNISGETPRRYYRFHTTDDGIVGWSEYSENYGSAGLTGVIRALAAQLVGADPRPVEKITA